MWIAIAVIGSVALLNMVISLFLLLRLREAETFMIIMSGVIIGGETSAQMAAYIRSRSDHPAGKKGVGLPRRMDEGGSPRTNGEH